MKRGLQNLSAGSRYEKFIRLSLTEKGKMGGSATKYSRKKNISSFKSGQ